MKKEYKLTVNQILYLMKRSDETKEALEEGLVEKSALQEEIETRYNDLVTLAEEGIQFLNQVHEGDVMTPGWVAEGQRLVALVDAMIETDIS